MNIETKTYTLTEHNELMRRARSGEATADELREAFKSATASKEAIKAEFSALSKDRILRIISRAHARKSDSKKTLVGYALHGVLWGLILGKPISFFLMSGNEDDAMLEISEALTDADVTEYAEQVAASTKRHAERMEGLKKSIENPETLEEFRLFIEFHGADKLTLEQQAQYDELAAGATRAKQAAESDRLAVVQAVDTGGVSMTIRETTHAKRGVPLFVVCMGDRVPRETYTDLLSKAKRLGGWYSRYAKGEAIPGFQFESLEAAEQFTALQSGDVSTAEQVQEHKEEKKGRAANRLIDMADRMEEAANEKLNAPRLTNTHKRADQAASMEADARKALALAGTIRNLGTAIESGEATHLEGIKNRTQIETLEKVLRLARYERLRAERKKEDNSGRYDHDERRREEDAAPTLEDVACAEYPFPSFNAEQLEREALTMKEKPGLKLIAGRFLKAARAAKRQGRNLVVFRYSCIDDVRKVASGGLRAGMGRYDVESFKEELADYDRMRAAGLETVEQLRAALREFVQYRGKKQEADPVTALERALIGQKIPGFFPTPPAVIVRLLDLAGIEPGMEVLEPSAGKGNIADAIREAVPGADLDTVEVSHTLRTILEAKGHRVAGSDFMEHSGAYDRVLMNPPFENGADADHVRRAFGMLKDGGRLVAIMGAGVFFRSDSKSAEFRDWLAGVGGYDEPLPEGSFMDRTEVRTTGVSSRIVVIDK